MDIEMHAQKSDKDVPKPENTDKKKTNRMICDDCMSGSQSIIEEQYTSGRHSHVNIFYITQRDLQNIYNDICSLDIDEYVTFKNLLIKCGIRKITSWSSIDLMRIRTGDIVKGLKNHLMK